jgi:hypothetical protein
MIAMSLVLAASLSLVDPGPDLPQVAAAAPAADQFLIVPLRIHILKSPGLELGDCKLQDREVERVIRNLNTIWRKAGIVFGIESIVREVAVQRDRFQLIVQLNDGQIGLREFQLLLPKPSRVFDGTHAYFFHTLPFNGAYLGEDLAVVQEGAALKEVAGGIDDPMARVLGHSFGAMFGLRQREEPPSSLLAMGTTGCDLDLGEIDRARRVARTIKGVLSVADAHKAAEAAQAAGRAEQAKLLRSWLGAVSGPAVIDSKKSCDGTDAASIPRSAQITRPA